MSAAIRKLTWDDIKDLPESHVEIVDGELVVSPPPSVGHQLICTRLADVIRPFVIDRDLGEFFPREVHVVLAEHIHYEPDMCFIGKGREIDPELPYFEGPPDLVIEVISESNRTHDTVVKYRDYERHGVREYWLVDPRERHIRVYVLESGAYRLLGVYAAGDELTSRVLEGLAFDPGPVFNLEARGWRTRPVP